MEMVKFSVPNLSSLLGNHAILDIFFFSFETTELTVQTTNTFKRVDEIFFFLYNLPSTHLDMCLAYTVM